MRDKSRDLQAVNEINAIKADPHVWTHDGDMAETYGLEPNYGCCTANFNQGWPKFAHMVVFSAHDGVAIGACVFSSLEMAGRFFPTGCCSTSIHKALCRVSRYAPMTVNAGNGVKVDIDTAYPFEDVITVTVSGNLEDISVYLRVPGWATNPAATLNGSPLGVANGTMAQETCAAGQQCVFELDFKPEIRVEEWGDFAADGARVQAGPYSIHRGALMYAMPLGLNFTQTAHYFGPVNDSSQSSNDYEVCAVTS